MTAEIFRQPQGKQNLLKKAVLNNLNLGRKSSYINNISKSYVSTGKKLEKDASSKSPASTTQKNFRPLYIEDRNKQQMYKILQ